VGGSGFSDAGFSTRLPPRRPHLPFSRNFPSLILSHDVFSDEPLPTQRAGAP